jgi:hypothetical protein
MEWTSWCECVLGLEADLQITGEFFDRFQALDPETTLRLISRDPPGLARAFHPIFPRELLESAQLLGLGVSLQTPAKGASPVETAIGKRGK